MNPEISVVIPVFNEKESIKKLYKKLVKVLERINESYEIIFVDDGSTDGSLGVLKSLSKVKVIVFRRNFGQTAALVAGFDHAKGSMVVTLDADLQNDPRDIPKLLDEYKKGYDVVSGWRKDRKDTFISRKVPSVFANWLISVISGVKLHDFGCTLKVYKREILKEIDLYGEMHRFIPAVLAATGASISEIAVTHHPRKYGEGKYGIGRTLTVLLDLIMMKFLLSYQTRPLQLFGKIGLFFSVVGSSIFMWLIYERLILHYPLSNRPLFLISIFFTLVGIQLIIIGLLAEMLMRIYFESLGKPTYLIREVTDD